MRRRAGVSIAKSFGRKGNHIPAFAGTVADGGAGIGEAVAKQFAEAAKRSRSRLKPILPAIRKRYRSQSLPALVRERAAV
ncbi:hypothetical protein AB4Z01_02485 [Inquilinus sp. YAF38]|uniref:hypothetical protein n=1 Tax=Inquilinus sp. YAF38 TaxID=3233084 RepID=UPI003F9154C9